MREKFNNLYLDSHERKLLIHSLVELKNQLIQQGRYTDCVDEIDFKCRRFFLRSLVLVYIATRLFSCSFADGQKEMTMVK